MASDTPAKLKPLSPKMTRRLSDPPVPSLANPRKCKATFARCCDTIYSINAAPTKPTSRGGMANFRRELEELRDKKRIKFEDVNRLIGRILDAHSELFPKYSINSKGSRVVYHFNVSDLYPLVLEREHRGRDFMLPKYAKRALDHVEHVLLFIEEES